MSSAGTRRSPDCEPRDWSGDLAVIRLNGRVGVITGSGTYDLASLEDPEPQLIETEFGTTEVTIGLLHGVEVVHVARHGDGHPRLSNHVDHRSNIAALALCGVRCALGLTICGAVDPALGIGDLIVFDDLYFPSNRLPDGALCTFFAEPGDPRRAHWIFERPFARSLRRELIDAARGADLVVQPSGCYGHVDGPRFNTAAEIRSLRQVGVTAVSQTGGPETVLAGEAGIPYALIGYVTDWANGAGPGTPVAELIRNMTSSKTVFRAVVDGAIADIGTVAVQAQGERYGFERDPIPFRTSSR